MITLRPYQIKAADAALEAIAARRRLLIVSPGGSGKTVVIAEVARRLAEVGKRTLIVSHRREIVRQTFAHLERMGVEDVQLANPIEGGRHINRPLKALVIVSSIVLARTREVEGGVDVIIFDEAHRAMAHSYLEVIARHGRSTMIGFTATPHRLDGRGLGDVFEDVYHAAMPSELIENNWLARPRMFAALGAIPDLRGVPMTHGDYVLGELERRSNTDKIVGNIVEHWMKYAEGEATLAFAVSIRHAEDIAARFRARGIPSEALSAKTPTRKRDGILKSLASGELKVVSSCILLSEGYDLPQCGCVIMARPTMSFVLAMQQMNRAMRYRRGKHPVLLDHAGNYIQFGFPHADRIYTLEKTVDTKGTAGTTKACPICGAVAIRGAEDCVECGHAFDRRSMRYAPSETNSWLAEITAKDGEVVYQKLLSFARSVGAPDGWAEKVSSAWMVAR